jgi:hypothetical protein
MHIHASDPTEPPIPDQPVIPDAPTPGAPDDVPDIGTPEPEPDQQPGRIGDESNVAISMLQTGSDREKMCRVVFGG